MNIEFALEKWCEKKGLDSSKIDEDLFYQVVNRIESDIDDFVDDNMNRFIGEWSFLIEQEVEEHPEWRLNTQENKT